MGAQKYTDAERVTVLGLYVENFQLPDIVTRTGLSRTAVASILGNMYALAIRHGAPRGQYLKRKVQRIHDAEPGLPSPHA